MGATASCSVFTVTAARCRWKSVCRPRSGDEQLVQAVIIDISHRKAAERRLREQADQLAVANRYKSEFLANMSHELRTPLSSILILSDQLRQNGAGNLNDKQVRHADIIHRAGHELLQLINVCWIWPRSNPATFSSSWSR